MPVPQKICQPWLYSFLLSIAGGLMVFSAVSGISPTEADNDTIWLVLGEEKQTNKNDVAMLRSAILT